MVLEAVYEQDFLTSSHGYRPGRSARTALTHLRQELMAMGGGWVLEVDIKMDRARGLGRFDLRPTCTCPLVPILSPVTMRGPAKGFGCQAHPPGSGESRTFSLPATDVIGMIPLACESIGWW
jgi:hypothetical protein